MKNSQNTETGMSLIEILVVIGIFAILGVLTTRSVILTIGGGKKSENLILVRENLNYSLGVIERQLRNADSITDTCPNGNTLKLNYLDQNGVASSFSCANLGAGIGYVASGSAKLTSDTIDVTACSIQCQKNTSGPSSVKVVLTGQDVGAVGISNSSVTVSTEVSLRNY